MSFEDLEDNDAILKAMMVEEEAELSQAINDLPTDLYNQFTIVRSAPFFLEFMNIQVTRVWRSSFS